MKLESSHKKIERIFGIIDGLDDLDKEAWMKLINSAEEERNEELIGQSKDNIKRSCEILDMILPLIRLTRLMLASKEVNQPMRVMIIRTIIGELISLLNPVETAGVLWSVGFSSFDSSRPRMMSIPMIIGPLGIEQEEDKSGAVV